MAFGKQLKGNREAINDHENASKDDREEAPHAPSALPHRHLTLL